MWHTLVLFSLALLAITAPASSSNHAQATVLAKPALVEIGPQPAVNRLLNLPSLEFPLTIEPRCAAGARIESLVISIADTQRRYVAADFAASGPLESTLLLPERQIGPLAIGQFCAAERLDPDPQRSLQIHDVFTASVSLRCSSDFGQTISFETLALDVSLSCKSAADEQSDAAAEMADIARDAGDSDRQDD